MSEFQKKTEKKKNLGGRPLKFRTPEEFEAKANAYFDATPIEEWTITGLALALDTTRDVLCDYQGRDEFSSAVKRAKLKVEHSYEKRLVKSGRAGDIFGLKNFGWVDKREVQQESKIEAAIKADVKLDISKMSDDELDRAIADTAKT